MTKNGVIQKAPAFFVNRKRDQFASENDGVRDKKIKTRSLDALQVAHQLGRGDIPKNSISKPNRAPKAVAVGENR